MENVLPSPALREATAQVVVCKSEQLKRPAFSNQHGWASRFAALEAVIRRFRRWLWTVVQDVLEVILVDPMHTTG